MPRPPTTGSIKQSNTLPTNWTTNYLFCPSHVSIAHYNWSTIGQNNKKSSSSPPLFFPCPLGDPVCLGRHFKWLALVRAGIINHTKFTKKPNQRGAWLGFVQRRSPGGHYPWRAQVIRRNWFYKVGTVLLQLIYNSLIRPSDYISHH